MGLFDFRLLSFIGIKIPPKAPWRKYYSRKHMRIRLKDENIYQFLLRKVEKNDCLDKTAITYFGNHITYRTFIKKINETARKFLNIGVKKFDIVTIISANVPEALYSFYALNKIGAVANMLHPLLSQNEIKDALNKYETKYVVALDTTIKTLDKIIDDTKVEKVIVISPSNSMNIFMKVFYYFRTLNNKKKLDKDLYIKWKKFLKTKYTGIYYDKTPQKDEPALILQSGGTTGVPKGIVLSNGNMNASTIAALNAYPDLCKDDRILGIMPIFHGFGLEVAINDAFCCGAEVILIPTFKASKFHELLIKHKPTVLVGVSTLFEALTKSKEMDNVDLSELKYVISGGDTLSKEKVENINKFLHEHGSRTNMIQGYGLTEAVAAASVDLRNLSKPGTIGIPWPGVYIGIFEPNTENRMDYNEDGEICVCGPTVMLGYYDNEGENISELNPYFCEMTGHYWVLKNYLDNCNEEYIGFGHYRRLPDLTSVSSEDTPSVFGMNYSESMGFFSQINAMDLSQYLLPYDIVLPCSCYMYENTVNPMLRDDIPHYNVLDHFHAEHKNDLLDTLRAVFMLVYPLMRSCCGGFHARTRTACFLSSMLVLAAVIAASKLIKDRPALFVSIGVFAAGALLIVLLAPVEAPNKPFDDVERVVFRRRSLIVTGAALIFCGALWLAGLYRLMLSAALAVFFTGAFLAVGRLSDRKGAV